MSVLNYPLSNVQVELMKLFSTNVSDSELIEVKDLLAAFYANKAIAQAAAIWDKNGLSDSDMTQWLKKKQ
jgi:hypothetical protein